MTANPSVSPGRYQYCGFESGYDLPVVADATANNMVTLTENVPTLLLLSNDCAKGVSVTGLSPASTTILAYYPSPKHAYAVVIELHAGSATLALGVPNGTTRNVQLTARSQK